MSGKIIIVSAPSGCGKSTIINALMDRGVINAQFSVSATNRAPRVGEVDGINYHFLSDQQFHDEIANGNFIEFEEVYPGRFYGTLRREVEHRMAEGNNVILDIDVCGGVNVKKMFGTHALSLFILPPSVDELRVRLKSRGTDDEAEINRRISRAEYELGFAKDYDATVVNDDLEKAIEETGCKINEFTGYSPKK